MRGGIGFRNIGVWLSVLAVISMTVGCELNPDEEPATARTFPNVQEELWPYFIKFEDEGRQRGISIDLRSAGIVGRIEEIVEDNVAGLCHFNSRQPNDLTIDQEFWDFAGELLKEFIVFHELGHCFLLRDHKEDQFPNRSCISIMRSGNGGCRDNYNLSTRESYLDELFDPEFAGDILGG